jgi:hypothetical protein
VGCVLKFPRKSLKVLESTKQVESNMPLDKKVTFQTRLQSQNRLQVPSHLRWQFKLEPAELLKITTNAVGVWDTTQIFYANVKKTAA